jgi:putative membrane protein
MQAPPDESSIFAIERPHPNLWKYYLLRCLATGPLFLLLVLPSWFRYQTMRYRFGPEGISMRWGILFRREILIQYARIQDIHLRSNLVERWLGLARVLVQTASGSASAEMTIEGLLQFEQVRDFLYDRMRGVKPAVEARATSGGVRAAGEATTDVELVGVLREVALELRELRRVVDTRIHGRREGGGND